MRAEAAQGTPTQTHISPSILVYKEYAPAGWEGFRDSGFGIRDPGFGFQVPGFGVRDSGFRFRVPGFGIRYSGFRFRVLGFGIRDSGFGRKRNPVGLDCEAVPRRARI